MENASNCGIIIHCACGVLVLEKSNREAQQLKKLPQDPLIQNLIKQARQHQLSRRAALAAFGGTAAALTLASCAPADQSSSTGLTPAVDVSDSEPIVTWHNWPSYIDMSDDETSYPTLEKFEAATGISVDYRVEIDDNDIYFGKIKDQLELGQDIGADLTTPTDWMVSRWVSAGYVQKLDVANIPNRSNLADAFMKATTNDPGRDYSLPYQGVFAGIAYDKAAYREATGQEAPRSVADLWQASLKGKVGAFLEMRDTLGLILLSQGIDIESADSLNADSFGTAIEFFEKQLIDGQIGKVYDNAGFFEDFANGDIIAGVAWAGDVAALNLEYDEERFGFVFPDSGTVISADVFTVPMGATHKKNAERLMNFYYDPEIAAEVAAWVNYVTPVVGAKEAAVAIDPELAESELIFPSQSTLDQTRAFRTLDSREEQSYSQLWQQVLLGA